jgi:Ca2+-binding EF-hand superfamily protein
VKEFKFMDRNSDGFVNADEFYKAAIRRRDQIDFNRDSKISKEEYNSNKPCLS